MTLLRRSASALDATSITHNGASDESDRSNTKRNAADDFAGAAVVHALADRRRAAESSERREEPIDDDWPLWIGVTWASRLDGGNGSKGTRRHQQRHQHASHWLPSLALGAELVEETRK